MIKRLIIIATVIGLLVSCPDPTNNSPENNPDNPDNPNNPQQNTTIVFDNTQGICAVAVYDSYQRREQDKIAEVPAGQFSAEIEYTPGTSVPFYFLYRINLKGINGFTLDYVPKEIGKDQTALRIDANTKTTVSIHKLDETVSSPNELLSEKSYLLIQNNSSFSFQLHRGTSILTPDNSSASLVNSGERAKYTINPGAASPYKLLVGADYKELSGSIVSFEAGRVYGFVFDGNVSLIAEVEIILENVAQTNARPDTPGTPAVTTSDELLILRWIAVQGAENYEVYISTTQEPPVLPAKTVAGTTTVLTGLTNKTAYYIWITAVNNSGSSDYSPFSRGIPWAANEKPATPGRPVIIPGINQLTVNWEECGGAASYEVYINTTTSSPSAPEITTEKTSAVINNLENDKIYFIWIKAVNSAGKSDYSPFEAGTPSIPTKTPAAPSRPILTVGSHKLTVSWQAVELAASYEVWLGTTDNSAQAQKQGGDITGGITEAVISGLENETNYYVWIKAKNVVGTSGFSPAVNAKPSAFAVLPETPAVPVVTIGNRELSVSWQSVEGALFYEIWTGATNNSANAVKYGADVSVPSVIITGLVNGTTYYIWIKAKNNIGESEFSPRANGMPSAFAATPSAPQTAPVVSSGNGQLTVSWQAVEGASVYEVWAGTDTNPTLATKRGGDISGLSSIISGLTNGTTYYIWIKAKNSVGASGFSPMASETPSVFSAAPQAPSAPSVSIGNGQITVSWAAVAGATDYEIWTGTSNNSASATKNGADISAALSVTIESLANGTTYYVWIKAKNAVGTSAFSSVASGKPIANAATPTLSASNDQLSVTWTAIAGADQYEIFCGSGINPPQTATKTINSPATSVTIGDLNNGTTYNVWVQGKNATGTGAMSDAASAKPVGNMGTVTILSGNGQLTANWTAVFGA
ncbi:MAG: fibronectin type III domain-containing protein, partial [Treponema sp.]|nr:fibronectin type III domain-containing protein [Treponema sp.]